MNKYFITLLLLLITSITRAQNIGGIGAQLLIDTADGYSMPRIMRLVPGSPADTTLRATDYIYKVNDVNCKDKTIEAVVNMIRGEVGTHVKITVTDTKDGKRPRTYDLVRAGVAGVTNQPPPDPVTAFNDRCEKETELLKGQKFTIIKTFNATCGDRYFNFEAAAKQYHVKVMTLEDKGTFFHATARVFDNDDEAGATTLTELGSKEQGTMSVAQCGGDVTFKKACIGVVNVQMHNDVTKCHAIYVVVYK